MYLIKVYLPSLTKNKSAKKTNRMNECSYYYLFKLGLHCAITFEVPNVKRDNIKHVCLKKLYASKRDTAVGLYCAIFCIVIA